MKKYLIIPFLVSFLACEDDSIKFFNAESLNDLNLASIDGMRLSGGENYVGVSVFTTVDIAINAMHARIGSVACIIEEGTTDEIEDTWWFTDCIPDIVFVSKLNTIIEVGIYSLDYNTVGDTLYKTANEIAVRVLNHSEWEE